MIEQLFTSALGLQSPWRVVSLQFLPEQGRIDFDLQCDARRLSCPVCHAADQPIHDRLKRTWRHLNFFQYQAYLNAAVPRVACACGKTTQVPVPWANEGSGFTLLFEAFALSLAKHMPMAAVARLLGVNANPLWARFTHIVKAAYHQESLANVRQICVDETASKRGHHYVTVVADVEARRVIFATEGKDALTLSDFASELTDHDAKPEQITAISMDFSAAFIKGAKEYLPQAEISFDPFHLVSLANVAVDQVRRGEVKQAPELKGQRWAFLKDQNTLKAKQKDFVSTLTKSHLQTARAWRMKEKLREIVRGHADKDQTSSELRALTAWLQRSRLEPMVRLGKTIKTHFEGITRAISEKRSNGFAESLNSIIQAAKSRARGFRSAVNFICMIYFLAGKLSHLPSCPWADARRTVPH